MAHFSITLHQGSHVTVSRSLLERRCRYRYVILAKKRYRFSYRRRYFTKKPDMWSMTGQWFYINDQVHLQFRMISRIRIDNFTSSTGKEALL